MKYFIRTFGCQMNVHDSERISGILAAKGLEESAGLKDADMVVLNTCSIREKAEQKFYSELGRLRKVKAHRPGLKIAVAGCIAQQEGERIFRRFPYVDFIFGPNNIDNLQDWDSAWNGKSRATAIEDNPHYHTKVLPVRRAGRVKAWVSVMYGCDNFCSYCVVPYTRGQERSRPVEDILKEVRGLVSEGYREITLLGQNVNSYGRTNNQSRDFPDLLKKLHDVHRLERIRFVTSHPRDLSEKLISALSDFPKVCEHIHLPLQSASDRILHLMNRGYSFDQYRDRVRQLRKAVPDIALTTDIITGFPGESEDDFAETLDALREIGFDGIFAFKYSKRPQTAALLLPDHVNETIKAERLSRVLQTQETITLKKNRTLEGKTIEILVEGESETDSDKLTGRTRTNKIVNYHGSAEDIGQLIQVKIVQAYQHSLLAVRTHRGRS